MATRNEIQLLNLAYFGRPSDPAGLAGWESTGLTPSEIVLRFVDTEEYQFNTIRPNQQGSTPDLAGLITTYYQRLFDRAPAQSEINGWVDALNQGLVNLDYLGITIANAGLNLAGSDLANTLNNKIEKANDFSDALGADQSIAERYTSWLAIAIGQDFNSEIGENTTDAEAAVFRAEAFARLPEPGVLIEVSTPGGTEVQEGNAIGIQVQGFGPDAPGTSIDYVIIGQNGFGGSDLVDGSLTGVVTLDSFGNGVVQIDIKDDGVDVGESFAVQFSAAPGLAIFTDTITVIDGPAPDPLLSVSAQPSAVDEGSILTFEINAENIAPGTEITYVVSGIDPADVNGASLSGTRTVNADGSVDAVVFQVSEDLSTEGQETATIVVNGGGAPAASTSAVINDTSFAPEGAVLTPETDIVTNDAATGFTVIGDERTLGQNDQISSAVDGAVLNIGTSGSFNIANFSTDNIETFQFTPSDSFGDDGFVDMRNAVGVTTLDIDRSSLNTFAFDDLQSAADLSAIIDDSFSDFVFNFDATALVGTGDSLDVLFAEAPIDAASGAALGLIVNQGPTNAPAALEVLNLFSLGVATDENVLDVLSVGPDLEVLNIAGDVDLKVAPNIGLAQFSFGTEVAGNSLIELIDAANLAANLYGGPVGGAIGNFTYTSSVDSRAADGSDVVVLGAEGFNYLELISAVDGQTDFDVLTQDGDDSILTSTGNDAVLAGNGDNTVFTFSGEDIITSGTGDDSIDSGADDDLVEAGSGDNNVIAGAGDNTVITLEGSDTILAFNGNDSVDSGLGDDIVITGDGADTIVSEGGNNTIIAGVFTDPGNIQDEGGDSVVTGAGNDTINVTGGSDTVRSGAGNDIVIEGNVGGGEIAVDGDSNFIFLEEGDDELVKNIENLQADDVIDGGAGIDTVTLTGGGVLRQSETLQTSNIEAFDLVDGGNFDVTLSNELVVTSDNIVDNQRIFSVFTGDGFTPGDEDSAGDVILDITNIAPISEGLENQPLFNSIRYFGQNDTNSERVIVNDAIMNQFTELRFGEAPANAIEVGPLVQDSDNGFDVIVVQDSAEITTSDLSNVDGLEVFDLTATNNGGSDFVFDFRGMTIADFQRLVGDISTYDEDPLLIDDGLLFRATPSLNTAFASSLTVILPVEAAAAQYIGNRIVIEESAELNVDVQGGNVAAINTALFFTPNADDLEPIGQTVTAFELNDVQAADRVTGTAATTDTIDFRFGLANEVLSMQEQLNNVATNNVEVFEFNPGAVNQAVEFDGLFPADKTINDLETVITSGGDDNMINIEQSLFVASNNGDDTVGALGVAFSANQLTVTAGSGNDSVDGNNGGADSLVGNAGNDTIQGRGGSDRIFGDEVDGSGDGNDSIDAGAGADTVNAGNGDNSVDAGIGDDSVVSGLGADTIDGDFGEDTILSGAGADSVLGGRQDDFINLGAGADFADAGNEDDTVLGGLGEDTILSGDGLDSINGGADNDLIGITDNVLTTDEITNGLVTDLDIDIVDADDTVPFDDTIDGGLGQDILAFGLDGTAVTLNEDNVQNVEQFNVTIADNNASLTIDNSILVGNLTVDEEILVVISDNDRTPSGFTFNSESFVQGQSVIFFDNDLTAGDQLRSFGAGDDAYYNDYDDATEDVTIAGNGGADLIDLSTEVGNVENVLYNTSNDGGVGGAPLGGDRIFNFEIGVDNVQIGTDNGAGAQASGLLFDLTQKQASSGAVAGLFQVENQILTLGGQTAADGAGNVLPGLAQNMLFLTGPARSLTDDQLVDASAIADVINDVGVQGNGLTFGEALPAAPAFTIQQQSNQALIVQQGQTSTALWLYVESAFDFDNPLSYTVETNELRQLGIFDNALLTQGDFETNLGTAVV